MKDYLKDKNALDIPFIESPFFDEIISNSSYTSTEKNILIEYNSNGYVTIDLELDGEFVHKLLVDVKNELESLNTQDDRYHYSDSPRVFEAWKTIPNVLSLAKHPKIIDTLKLLYGRNPIPFQTINFLKGSNQPLHQDSIHFYTEPQRWMVGTWTALQNMTTDCGPLTIVPGSHKWPHYNFQNLNLPVVEYGNQFDNYAEYENFLVQLLESMNGKKKEWLGKTGECIIWASNLLHGGAPIINPNSTRYAQATHFYFEGCNHYYSPMFSDVANGKYSEKDLTQKDILKHEI